MKISEDLRISILHDAIQGKLTRQFPDEENATELVESINELKSKLIKDKIIKKEKPIDDLNESDASFAIPESWRMIRLGECIHLLSGQDLTPQEYNSLGSGTIYLTGASNIDDNGNIIVNRWTEHPKAIAKKGDLLVSCKGTIGKTHILEYESVHIARQFMAIRSFGCDINYIHIFIKQYVDKLKRQAKSMIPGIERNNVLLAEFPLPPLAEQHRIVARVDELMAKIDELEEVENQLETLKSEFPGEMKDAILQAAMQGKLTKRSNVLESKQELKEITEECDCPQNWKEVKFSEVSDIYTGNSISESEKKLKYMNLDSGRNYIGTKDVGFNHSINYNNGVRIPENEAKFKIAKAGSTLLCVEGGSAGKKIAMTNQDVCFGNKLCSFNASKHINAKFQYYLIQSPVFGRTFKENITGMIGGVSINKIKEMLIPLPPLEEQQTIVDKLDRLLPLVEGLKEA